jgi:hypothetical protein
MDVLITTPAQSHLTSHLMTGFPLISHTISLSHDPTSCSNQPAKQALLSQSFLVQPKSAFIRIQDKERCPTPLAS